MEEDPVRLRSRAKFGGRLATTSLRHTTLIPDRGRPLHHVRSMRATICWSRGRVK